VLRHVRSLQRGHPWDVESATRRAHHRGERGVVRAIPGRGIAAAVRKELEGRMGGGEET
jgi:hypothetical protein